jgi:hypothetical protein
LGKNATLHVKTCWLGVIIFGKARAGTLPNGPKDFNPNEPFLSIFATYIYAHSLLAALALTIMPPTLAIVIPKYGAIWAIWQSSSKRNLFENHSFSSKR